MAKDEVRARALEAEARSRSLDNDEVHEAASLVKKLSSSDPAGAAAAYAAIQLTCRRRKCGRLRSLERTALSDLKKGQNRRRNECRSR